MKYLKYIFITILAFIVILIGWAAIDVIEARVYPRWSWQWAFLLSLAQLLIYPAVKYWMVVIEKWLSTSFRMIKHPDIHGFPDKYILQKRDMFSRKWEFFDVYDVEGKQNTEGIAKIYFNQKYGINIK